jgi:hypothetical protein
MHDVAAGKTAGREKTKPRGLSIVRGGRGVAGRTVALIGVKFATGRRERRLTDDEYRMLGMALSNAAQEGSGSPL